ncbi:MAG: DUF2849 domain-containing protein [Proteobacteria bacterium]|nr:DUF2849 domain-containing protein [Pseudomonadota bacterium]
MPRTIVTANRLRDGEVVYLAPGGRWAERLVEAEAAESEPDLARLLATAEQAVRALLVVGPYEMPVERAEGELRPLSQRERIRALGPTVRADLGKQAYQAAVRRSVADVPV